MADAAAGDMAEAVVAGAGAVVAVDAEAMGAVADAAVAAATVAEATAAIAGIAGNGRHSFYLLRTYLAALGDYHL